MPAPAEMVDYKTYLARQLLAEEKLVTFRLLSRDLKVHVNTAKEMLWDFYQWRNDQRPGTVHATYLVYGTRKKVTEQGGDVEMADSKPEKGRSSSSLPARTLTLVKEENLHDVLGQYEKVSSIHVYSLTSHSLKDIDLLTGTARYLQRRVAEEGYSEDIAKSCGFIKNHGMWKRQRPGEASSKAAAAAQAPPVAEPKSQAKEEAKPVKEEPKAATAKEPKTTATSAAKKAAAASTPGMKRQGSSSSGGIGQMFAKAASKPKKPVVEKKEAPSPALSDEGEDDDSEAVPEAKQTTETGRARKDRQAELQRMMEESDEEEPGAAAETPVEEDPMEEDAPPPEPEPEPEPEPVSQEDEGPAEVVSSNGDGRKRGRRRVTKKKQIMDDQGYLVTIQEQGWESFSEEDTPPVSSKAKPQVEKSASSAKPKKAAPKGQGNIMSFFSKK